MNEDLLDIKYSQLRLYDFAPLFNPINYNGKELSDEERKGLVTIIDETISDYSAGLPRIQDVLESSRNLQGEYHTVNSTVASVLLFTTLTMSDCLASCKYFILADTDYDRRFMRGKMMIILNEGFKQLYGFDTKTQKKSEWSRLETLMGHFPADIQRQYAELTDLLQQHAQSSSWWKDERDYETHFDAEKLYLSRQEEVIESKVITDNVKLFNTLHAISLFLGNVHACLLNYLLDKHHRGELVSE